MDSVGHWSMDGMGNNWSSVDSVSNNRCGMDSVGNWSWSISWSWGSLVGRGWLVGLLLWVDSGSSVGDISNKTIISIAGVGHGLDSAIGKSNSVGSLDIAGSIRSLLSIEGSLGVVISNSVGVGVGGDLISIFLSLVSRGRGMVGWSSVGNNSRSMVGGSGMGNNWGSMDSMSNNWGSVHSMSGVSNNWCGGMNSVGKWGMGNNWSVSNSVVNWGN